MIKSNFTRPPAGYPSIELSCSPDYDLSDSYFEKNFLKVGKRDSSVYYYIEGGSVPGPDDIKFILKGELRIIRKYINSEKLSYDERWIRQATREELTELYKEHLAGSESELLSAWKSGNYYVSEGIELVPNKNLEMVNIVGYSQGDYASVIYCPDDFKKAWGAFGKYQKNTLKDYFTQLFYDTPICARFTIDGVDYNYNDMCSSEYEWDREAFAMWVFKSHNENSPTKIKDYKYLLDMLPKDVI